MTPRLPIVLLSLLLCTPAAAQQDDADQTSGYESEPRQIGLPGDVEHDIEDSFPKRDSLFSGLVPEGWAALKRGLYDETGLKLATSYQMIGMYANDVVRGDDRAFGGMYLFEAKWDAFRRQQDYQGSIVFAWNHLHTNHEQPALLFFNTGSITPHDAFYLDVGSFVSILFWEQWLNRDRLVLRVGQQSTPGVLDFFRFKDVRTSFSNPALGFAVTSIPFAPPGPGVTLKWWPVEGSELYTVLNVNDINSVINEFDWSPLFDTQDVFVGFEAGYNWLREGPEMDHVHLNLWYADEPSEKLFPSDKGWGLKVAGEKQAGKFVGFANYAYNTARGGGFGFTFHKHAANVGLAYTRPFGIRGEMAASYTFVKSLDGGGCGAINCDGSSQSAIEMYWKILVTPDLWLTPGVQLAIDPANNPDREVVAIGVIKLRLFF